jgi:hypothetical protein
VSGKPSSRHGVHLEGNHPPLGRSRGGAELDCWRGPGRQRGGSQRRGGQAKATRIRRGEVQHAEAVICSNNVGYDIRAVHDPLELGIVVQANVQVRHEGLEDTGRKALKHLAAHSVLGPTVTLHDGIQDRSEARDKFRRPLN